MFRIIFIAGLILGIYFLVKDYRFDDADKQENVDPTHTEESAKSDTNDFVDHEPTNSLEDISKELTEIKQVERKQPQEFHADQWLPSQWGKFKSSKDIDDKYFTDVGEYEVLPELKMSDNELDSLRMEYIKKIERNYSTIMAD